jgi:hypothetical protein
MTDQIHLMVATPCFGGQVVFYGDVSPRFAAPARAANAA